jgi:hypothetical protein
MSRVLDPNESYTFSQIFELKIPADELAEEFGYGYRRSKLDLPKYDGILDRLDEMRSRNQEPRRKRTRYETATFGFLQTPQGAGNPPLSD